jgi:hypothetical protein
MFTTSSLQLLALTRQHVVGDLLARYCNPVSVRTEGYVSNWQRGSVQDLLKLVAVECVFAHCAILGPGYEEAALRPRQYFLCHLNSSTYTSYDGCVVFLAVVHSDRLIVGSGAEYATVVVDPSGYELLSVRCVGKIGCARSI